MSHVEINSRVGADGVLRIAVPFGPNEANRDVKVTVEPAAVLTPPGEPSREEWRDFVAEHGRLHFRSTFQRAEQGEYERRSEAFP